MNIESGHIAFAVLLAIFLSSGVAWVIAGLYRRRMLALMKGAGASSTSQTARAATQAKVATQTPAPPHAAPLLDLAANRQATRRLLVGLTGLCLLIAFTQGIIALRVHFDALTFNRLLLFTAIYGWPMVLAWGLALRWPWRRVIGGIVLYVALMYVVAMWRSTEQQSAATVALWLVSEVGTPLAVTLLISASGRIRAVAPYLLPPALLLSTATMLALQLLSIDVFGAHVITAPLLNVFGATGTILVCALAPWVILAWPVAAIGRTMAMAYRTKRFSDLGYLFAVYWFVVLISNAVPAFSGVGTVGFALMLPWLWIPLAFTLMRRAVRPQAAAPNLLVLRVFQRDAEVEALFDQVIERWRFTGNTMLIAGSDLISRTLDPDDLFTFLSGRLHERFIDSDADVARRFAGFDLAPDPDGRYRVNECYCRDATWEAALDALVKRCDVVLMDLRGFQARNAGCRHELGVLSRSANLRRVVVLYDDATDRAIAQTDIGTAPAGRFLWLDAGRMNVAKAREVFASLFATAPDASQSQAMIGGVAA